MNTKLIRFHSGTKKGIIAPDYRNAWWLRNGELIRGIRSQMQVGDLSAVYDERFNSIKTLVPITKVEVLD